MESVLETSLYEILWKARSARQQETSKYNDIRVHLPDTVVYMYSKAQNWYYSDPSPDKRGRVKKRASLSSARILEKMTESPSRSGLVACCITASAESDTGVELRYFTADELVDVLQRDGMPGDAVLQRFVEPKPCIEGQVHNSVIQSCWQPNHCYIERRQNRHLLYDKRIPVSHRAETIESLRHSMSFPLHSQLTMECIKELCNGVAEHVFFVTDLVVK
eukprot:gene14608-22339_t